MSKLSDYSKFDHLDSDTENDEIGSRDGGTEEKDDFRVALPTAAAADSATSTKTHPTLAGRYTFSYNNQKVYEWEQSLEEVIIYIDSPPELPKKHTASYILVDILPNRLRVGLKGGDRKFIDEKTFDKVKVNESSWYLDEGVITIVLAKCFRGQTWEGVLCGHSAAGDGCDSARNIQESIDPFTKQEMQRTLMLERFGEENPGFDFRDAKFNGEVPDPRTFMGGVKHF